LAAFRTLCVRSAFVEIACAQTGADMNRLSGELSAMCNHLRSRPTSGASLRGKVQDGSKSTHPCRHLVVAPIFAIGVLAAFASAVPGAELRPETIAAFNRYVALTEQRMDHEPFLIVDALPEPARQATLTDLHSGGLRIEPLDTAMPDDVSRSPGGSFTIGSAMYFCLACP
jgi:hypothetical protein